MSVDWIHYKKKDFKKAVEKGKVKKTFLTGYNELHLSDILIYGSGYDKTDAFKYKTISLAGKKARNNGAGYK